jgi:putative hydrolase of the HAD superfamily
VTGPVDPLRHVETWIFDLDNTLYPSRSNLFAQVDRRMGEYLVRLTGLDPVAARAEQKRLFRTHGTTLRGLMTERGIDPHDFLGYVHDIDVSVVDPDPGLAASLAALPGRKIVFTNGSVAHAERVMDRLGVAGAFCGIFDIVASGFEPKPAPAPYDALVALHALDPRRAVMVEDMARNLVPARALGMTTAWVRTGSDFADAPEEGAVDVVVDDTAAWLAAVVLARAAG